MITVESIAEVKCKSIPIRGYYVYAIIENGAVCYIGKGKGNRVLSHFHQSSNQLLASRIKNNKTAFDWTIVSQFHDEQECLEYEEKLIKQCKYLGIELYNSTHYASQKLDNQFIKGVFEVFKQFEQRIFPISLPSNVIKPIDRAALILDICKKKYSNLKTMPIYKGKNITELTCKEVIFANYCKVIVE